jgi:hypothetical protein
MSRTPALRCAAEPAMSPPEHRTNPASSSSKAEITITRREPSCFPPLKARILKIRLYGCGLRSAETAIRVARLVAPEAVDRQRVDRGPCSRCDANEVRDQLGRPTASGEVEPVGYAITRRTYPATAPGAQHSGRMQLAVLRGEAQAFPRSRAAWVEGISALPHRLRRGPPLARAECDAAVATLADQGRDPSLHLRGSRPHRLTLASCP